MRVHRQDWAFEPALVEVAGEDRAHRTLLVAGADQGERLRLEHMGSHGDGLTGLGAAAASAGLPAPPMSAAAENAASLMPDPLCLSFLGRDADLTSGVNACT